MAINEIGFLKRDDEDELDTDLRTYLTKEKCANIILKPYVQTCCDKELVMKSLLNTNPYMIVAWCILVVIMLMKDH